MPPRPPVAHDTRIVLFSSGTSRQGEVQDDVLGHRPIGWDDHLDGHRLDWITIADPEVVRLSGSDRHPALVADIEVVPRGGATARVYTLAEVAP